MNLRPNKKKNNLRRALVHALVLIGLIPRFLVPVGYMPAALADGSPIMLCDAYVGITHHSAAATAHADEHDAAPTTDRAHAGHNHQAPTADPNSFPAEGNDDDSHAEWKRCSLGGLASLAAIHHEFQLAILPVSQERPFTAIPSGDTRATRIAFRSRAPPALI